MGTLLQDVRFTFRSLRKASAFPLAAIATLALGIGAAIGIYGVVGYATSQRRNEMATRLALGATPGGVFWLVMKQGGLLALVGTVIGVGAAYLSGGIVSSQVYAIRASDPVMLTGAVALVVVITVLATMIPAWRVSRLSPSNVLRPE